MSYVRYEELRCVWRGRLTFKLVLADVDGHEGRDDVGDEVVDHLEVQSWIQETRR